MKEVKTETIQQFHQYIGSGLRLSQITKHQLECQVKMAIQS